MFKKLKEKITEEVKSSPQRFQQFTQSVSDKLQNSATSDDNFFSIGEDDANTSSSSFEPGFSTVSLPSPQDGRLRRNSNSSVASDVSFLPRYESVGNMYHLQSDLDISTSEMEDNASTSSQLGQLSKEQIYSAFQKAQMRYHKYRGRYTDLARHYKDQERENNKMKTVLVETQDKAIRRVTELKEQCVLEQKAKAHLESALRDEIDEKQLKIQSLETKIQLLQTEGNSNQDTESLEILDKYLTEARQEIENLNKKMQEMKANSIIFQTKEQEYKTKIDRLSNEIALFAEREQENNLTLAQNKMELHNELLTKDTEIANVKRENEALKQNLALTGGNNKLENLQTQNQNLIEKLENLTQKCNTYENDLLKMEQFKIELEQANLKNLELNTKLKEAEDQCEKIREDAKKGLLSLEGKVRMKIQEEFQVKEEELKTDFQKNFEEVSSNAHNLQQIQLKLIEKDHEIKSLRQANERSLEDLNIKISKYAELERNYLELIEDSVGLKNKITNFEKEMSTINNAYQAADAKISRLEEQIQILEEEKERLLQMFQSDDRLEELTLKLQELEENNGMLLEKLEEKSKDNVELNQELGRVKNSTQKRETILEEHTIELQRKFGEELNKFRTKNDETELLRKKSEGELETVTQEKDNLLLTVRGNEDQITSLKDINAAQLIKHQEMERKSKRLLEEVRQTSDDRVTSLEQVNLELNTQLSAFNVEKAQQVEESTVIIKNLEEANLSLSQQLSEKQMVVRNLEETVNHLNVELTTVTDSLQKRELHITELIEDKSRNVSREDEYLQEISLLKKLLEEANNSLTIKEHESERIEEEHANNIEKLSKEIENRFKETYDDDLKSKDQEIGELSKMIEEYNVFIDERNEGLLEVLKFSEESFNHFKHKEDNHLNSVQNFERKFALEKHNFVKTLEYLKEFSLKHSSVLSDKSNLESDKETLVEQIGDLQGQMKQIQAALVQLREDKLNLTKEVEKLTENLAELELRNTQIVSDSNFLSEENQGLIAELACLKIDDEDVNLKYRNSHLEVERLKIITVELEEKLDKTVRNQQELEMHVHELERGKQLLHDELNIPPISVQNNHINKDEEIEHLRDKLTQYKSLDLTNRSSIEFYENELQKFKNQNEKLNRKLDETLVTLNHCAELSTSTEVEYLKNVLYNYMLGKESLVLARVIAAVCKFDPHQTETILAKEQQKQSLLGHLGIL